MGLELNVDVIGRVLEERRDAEEKEKRLKEELDRLKKEREELSKGGDAGKTEQIRSLDLKIGKLEQELGQQCERVKNACMIARTFTAGD